MGRGGRGRGQSHSDLNRDGGGYGSDGSASRKTDRAPWRGREREGWGGRGGGGRERDTPARVIIRNQRTSVSPSASGKSTTKEQIVPVYLMLKRMSTMHTLMLEHMTVLYNICQSVSVYYHQLPFLLSSLQNSLTLFSWSWRPKTQAELSIPLQTALTTTP